MHVTADPSPCHKEVAIKMSITAVISEYHPFHSGHAYLLEKAAEKTGADHSLSVMSGCFSQQGMPMYWDKLTRAAAACAGGVDLIFELPVLFATGSAGDFAFGAVTLLEQLHGVGYLCFGVEDTDAESFDRITDILLDEPLKYRVRLKDALASGLNYPGAREEALSAVLGDQVHPILSKPNNILALEYILMLKKLSSAIRPVMIRRKGDYHGNAGAGFASATDIRNIITAGNDIPEDAMPGASRKLLENAGYALKNPEKPLSTLLAAALLTAPSDPDPGELPMDMSPELYRRLTGLSLPISWNAAADALNTKNITRGRACRSMLHMLLGITNRDRSTVLGSNESLYLNLLAARKESTHLLNELQKNSDCMIITKRSRFHPEAGTHKELLWNIDRKAVDIYNQLLYQCCGIIRPDELRTSPVVV